MRCIIYENKTSKTVIMEYVFNSNYEKHLHFLECQENIMIHWHGRVKGNLIRAFWCCLTGHKIVKPIRGW